MTARKTPAKKSEHDQAAETDPKAGDHAEVTPPAADAEAHTANPPLAQVEEYQSVGVDPEFLAGQTVEPDFDQAEHERSLAAGREYLDSRTRNLP